ncbi:MAG: hypothetical protein LBI58_06735 [Tannerellaceae bacterium]|jgi:chitinase|nr:hypothetical protein [Tannerellaceae bacterium]
MFYAQDAFPQYHIGEVRLWDKYPPEVQQRGFGVSGSQLVQMDDDPQLEEVFLFSSDNGHYPYFDIFRIYYVIVDYHTKEVKYTSDTVLSTERVITLEDRNNDGRFELYRRYFLGGKFSVDEKGDKLSVSWVYDCISF